MKLSQQHVYTVKNSDFSAYMLIIATMIIWGTTEVVGKWIVRDTAGPTIPPMMIALLRFFIAVCCFFVLLKMREKSFHLAFVKKHFFLLVFMGLLSVTIYQLGYLYGLSYTAASDASLIVGTAPILVLLLSAIVFKESITWKKFFGTLLGFLGILLIIGFSPNVHEPDRLLGDGLILITVISYGSYSIALQYLMNQYKSNDPNKPSSLNTLTWVSFFGFITTLPIAFILSPDYLTNLTLYLVIPERIWIGTLYLAIIATVLAYVMFAEGIFRLTASRVAIFGNLIPLVGIILAAIFLQEKIDPIAHIFSLILISAGVILVNRIDKKSSQQKHLIQEGSTDNFTNTKSTSLASNNNID